MTVLSMDDEEFESGEYEVFRDEDGDRRVECWSDGDWVRIGRDVREGRCIEYHIEQHESVVNNIRYSSGACMWSTKAGYGADVTYYTIHESLRPYVVHNREVVLVMGDDGWPLYKGADLCLEQRIDSDYEDIARSYVEAEWPYREVVLCDQMGLSNNVKVSFLDARGIIDIRLIDDLREREEVVPNSVNAKARQNDGEEMPDVEYTFTVITDALTSPEDQ